MYDADVLTEAEFATASGNIHADLLSVSGTLQTQINNIAEWSFVSVSGSYTSSNMEEVYVNTSGGSFTIGLPSSPSLGNKVTFVDATGSFGTNAVTISGSHNIKGSSQAINLDVPGIITTFYYTNTNYGWIFS